ncbi:MAG: pentapeptide repeat-containing protein [Pseudomonadota bacterium]
MVDEVWTVLTIGVLIALLLMIGVLALAGSGQDKSPVARIKDAFGLDDTAARLAVLAAGFWAILFLALFSGLLMMLFQSVGMVVTGQGLDTVRIGLFAIAALTATLGAVVALPFTVIRIALTRKSTETAEASLFNEKINAASGDLHAMRLISRRSYDDNGAEVWRDHHEADVVRRNAAIDRLEGLVREQPVEAERVARLLSVYVRELSRFNEHPPQEPPEGASPEELAKWVGTLEDLPSEMETAAKTLGRLSAVVGEAFDGRWISLEGANLQRADLRWSDYRNANLIHAQLQGAKLYEAQLQGANLIRAQLQGSILAHAQLRQAILIDAKLERADLSGAQLQEAHLDLAQLRAANLREAQLQGTFLKDADLQSSNLNGARLDGAKLRGAQLQFANLQGTQLRAADLESASLNGAYLKHVQMDNDTILDASSFRGAALKSCQFTNIFLFGLQIEQVFGDASVTLPDGVRPSDADNWPEHFARDHLDEHEFFKQWRAFQASIGFDPDDPATWDKPKN